MTSDKSYSGQQKVLCHIRGIVTSSIIRELRRARNGYSPQRQLAAHTSLANPCTAPPRDHISRLLVGGIVAGRRGRVGRELEGWRPGRGTELDGEGDAQRLSFRLESYACSSGLLSIVDGPILG